MKICIALIVIGAAVISAQEMCDTSGKSSTYCETVSSTSSAKGERTIKATGCANHVQIKINPNCALEQSYDTTVPSRPMLKGADISSSASLAQSGGEIGWTFNGVGIYSCFAGGDACTDYASSANAFEGDTFDQCGGHSTGFGGYHYHMAPVCLNNQIGQCANEHSPQLGWMADGFPIYGPHGPGGELMKVCATAGGGGVCTDACGGYAAELPDIDDFKYRYYFLGALSNEKDNPTKPLPDESYFPFAPVCFRGCCPQGMTCDRSVPACDGSAQDGFTAGYTPAACAGETTLYVAETGNPDLNCSTTSKMTCNGNFAGSAACTATSGIGNLSGNCEASSGGPMAPKVAAGIFAVLVVSIAFWCLCVRKADGDKSNGV